MNWMEIAIGIIGTLSVWALREIYTIKSQDLKHIAVTLTEIKGDIKHMMNHQDKQDRLFDNIREHDKL